MKKDEPTCPYNIHIGCTEQNKCHLCGWNPEVDAARKRRISYGLPPIKKNGTA